MECSRWKVLVTHIPLVSTGEFMLEFTEQLVPLSIIETVVLSL